MHYHSQPRATCTRLRSLRLLHAAARSITAGDCRSRIRSVHRDDHIIKPILDDRPLWGDL
jgi:hypothetical protein